MAISEACQFEIRDEVNGMIEREDVGTKTEAFEKMVEFYASIGIEINLNTLRTKYYRAEDVSNETKSEATENTNNPPQLEKLEKNHGGARQGAGRKPKERVNPPQYSDGQEEETLDEYVARQSARLGSQALYLADLAISQLSRIQPDDPYKPEALEKVIDWVHRNA